MKFLSISLLSLFISASFLPAAQSLLPDVKRILILGDSITHSGQYIGFLETVLIADTDRRYEIIGSGLSSETVSGLSEEGHAGGKFPRPDLHERLGRVLDTTKPELVLASYGMNCGIYQPLDEARFQKYKEGIQFLRDKAKDVGARVIHLTPPVYDPIQKKGEAPFYNDVLGTYGKWLMEQKSGGWTVIDIHEPMNEALAGLRKSDPSAYLSKDGVHPGPEGHWLMAQQILKAWGVHTNRTLSDFTEPSGKLYALHSLVSQRQKILSSSYLSAAGHTRPGVAAGLPLPEALKQATTLTLQIDQLGSGAPFPGKKSAWNGYDKFDFEVDGKPVLVVTPKEAATGRPWVWHGEFFGHKPAPDIALLSKGFHIVYMSVPNMLGSPQAVKHWNALHEELTTTYGLSTKPALVGLSRGGLYCYNWAAANPDKVSCIYADAPVCDFKSWPGGKGKGKGDPKNWSLVSELWAFKNEAEALAYKGNPIDKLAPLAKNRVPLLHVFGDADDVVPWYENTGIIEEKYKALGGSITLIRKPGVGHHPHGLDDSAPIIEFITRHADGK
jgi:pimeloyl-ACP methyl ester carboxylesterase/lysophospholipase L1-like esterase